MNHLFILAVVASAGLCRGDSFYQLSGATISCSNDTSWQRGSVRGGDGFTAWVSGDGGCPDIRSSDVSIDFSAYSFHEASADAFEALSGYDLSIGGFLSATGPSIESSTDQSTVVAWSAFGGFIGLDGQAVNFSGSGSGVAYFEYYRGHLSNITWLLYADPVALPIARSLVATPEPSSVILFGLAIVCWAIVWRSRTSKNDRAASIR